MSVFRSSNQNSGQKSFTVEYLRTATKGLRDELCKFLFEIRSVNLFYHGCGCALVWKQNTDPHYRVKNCIRAQQV
jgi:hypothetical protein